MSRKGIVLVLAAAVAIALGAGAAAAKPQQSVTLSFLGPVENRAPWDAIIGNFERQYPNIHIEATYTPGADEGQLLLTEFQAGSAPDLFPIATGASTNFAVYPLGFQGKLLDLTGSPWVKRIYPGVVKFVSVHRRIYGFPAGYNLSGLWYNPAALSQLGISGPPTKFSELIADCQQAAAQGKFLIALGFASQAHVIQLTQNLIGTFVYRLDPKWTLERDQHKVTFAGSPLWHRALQALVDMKDANCFNPAPEGTSRTAAQTMFATGQAAILPGNSGDLGLLKGINPNVDARLTPFPADDPKNTGMGLGNGGNVLVANNATSHPKEAKTFIDFVARPKQNAFFCKVAGCSSGDDLRKGVVPDFAKDVLPFLKSGNVYYTSTADWPGIDKGLFSPQFVGLVPGLFTGQETVDQILQTMDGLWDKP